MTKSLKIAVIIFGLLLTYLFGKWLVDLLPKSMSNNEVIEQIQLCEKAGLKSERLMNGLTSKTTAIQCIPKDESHD